MHTAPEIINIPLNKLIACPDNVRKTGVTQGLEEMKANIAAIGLLHPLSVRKAARGKFSVVAGQRRHLALSALAGEGRIENDAPVACRLIDSKANAAEISLAENAVRLPMHPMDQFEAFASLIDKGATPADVAARFGVSEATVKKRMKLARVSPVILAAYREDELSLEQVAAFAVTDDHAAQERVYGNLSPWNRDADDIRASLTQDETGASDRRVRFIGLDAYEAAGGTVRRDLFHDGDDGVFIDDTQLLDRLVMEKLQAEAGAVRAEGWKWVEAHPSFDHEARSAFGRRHAEPVPLSGEDTAELESLIDEFETLAENADEEDEEAAERLAELEAHIRTLEDRESVYTPEALSAAGAVVSLGNNGKLEIHRGLVRAEDEPEQEDSEDEAVEEIAARPKHSAALVENLTACKSAAIGATLAGDSEVALAAVVHALALRVFGIDGKSSVQLSGAVKRYREASAGADRLEQHRAEWGERIPGGAEALWQWCLTQSRDTLLELLAFCAGSMVDAVQVKHEKPDHPRLTHARALTAALGLDMAAWFTPTTVNYFGRVSHAVILEALGEAKGKPPLRSWQKLRKGELAVLAEREIAGTSWLPEPLRA